MFSSLLVVECASVLAGPQVGQFFAELGARVIKVEHAEVGGDVTRSWKLASESGHADRSAYFLSTNSSKESIGLNLAKKEDLDLLGRMIDRADVLLHNYKRSDVEKFGLDYASCSLRNPGLIYASISGYGKDDPRVGYDAVIQAESGFMSINGQPQSAPTKLPVALMDVLAAQQLRQAILLALIERMNSKKGSEVHCSLRDAAICSLVNQASNVLNAHVEPTQSGSDHPNIAPYGTLFQTSDQRWLLVAIGTDQQFRSLCRVLNLADQDRFSTNHLRVQNRAALSEVLREAIAMFESEIILSRCRAALIPAACVTTIGEALGLESEHLLSRHEDATVGLRTIGFTASFLKAKPLSAAPHLDEQGQSIREEFASIAGTPKS